MTVLQFLSTFLFQLAYIAQLESIKTLSDMFLNTILKAQKIANINRDDYKQFVCCTKCLAIYSMEDCFDVVDTQRVPKLCTSARFSR